MNLILTHILAQVQYNRNVIHQCTKWKRSLSSFSSGYMQQHHHLKCQKRSHGWKVQKVPLITECCTAHTTGTVQSPLCKCWCLTMRLFTASLITHITVIEMLTIM